MKSGWRGMAVLAVGVVAVAAGAGLAAFGRGEAVYIGWWIVLVFGPMLALVVASRLPGWAPPPRLDGSAELALQPTGRRLLSGLMFLGVTAGSAMMLAGCLRTEMGHDVRPWIASVLGLPAGLWLTILFLRPAPKAAPRLRVDAFGVELEGGVRRPWSEVAGMDYTRATARRLTLRFRSGEALTLSLPAAVDGFSLVAVLAVAAAHVPVQGFAVPGPRPAEPPPRGWRSTAI